MSSRQVQSSLTRDFDLFTSQEEVAEQDQILQITSTTGQVTEVDLTQLSISERTSNGSFVNDTISDQEVFQLLSNKRNRRSILGLTFFENKFSEN